MTRPFHPANFYGKRLVAVIEYIDENLAEPLLLSELSDKAAFSPSHFHKIFSEWMGETPQAYLRRCRLERAAALLRYGPDMQAKQIAPQCGYKSPEAFNRAFHTYFGMTPIEWRLGGYTRWNKSPECVPPDSIKELAHSQVTVKIMQPFRVAYKRKLGSYSEGEAELWKEFSGLIEPLDIDVQDCYGLGLDDPTVTPASRCRFDACIKLPPVVSVPNPMPVRRIPGGYYAILKYDGIAGNTAGHWSWLFNVWLPASGFKISKNASFERYPSGVPHIGMPIHSELYLPLAK